MKTVWIVTTGEDNEGGRVVDVFKLCGSAVECAVKLMGSNDHEAWTQEAHDDDFILFHNEGIDYIKIGRYPVK